MCFNTSDFNVSEAWKKKKKSATCGKNKAKGLSWLAHQISTKKETEYFLTLKFVLDLIFLPFTVLATQEAGTATYVWNAVCTIFRAITSLTNKADLHLEEKLFALVHFIISRLVQ